MGDDGQPDQDDFSDVKRRFERLEDRRQHLSSQIHQNLYLSLIISAGVLGIFGSNQDDTVRLLASVIAIITFGGLGRWTALYVDSREQVKEEKRAIYNEYRDHTYFEFADGLNNISRKKQSRKYDILLWFYLLATGGAIIIAIISVF